MSEQNWFGYGSILWWAYVAITAAVFLSCLGLWIYAVKVYPQSHAESDRDNLVDASEAPPTGARRGVVIDRVRRPSGGDRQQRTRIQGRSFSGSSDFTGV